MILATNNYLGVGLYTPEEAAMYARVNPRTMQRWVFGDGASDAVINAQLGSEDKIVTFLDFVQAMAIRSVRLCETKFPLQKIRRACELATKTWSVKYPLAAKGHRIFIFGPANNPQKCEMVISIGTDESGEDVILQLTGKRAGNRLITKVAEPFMYGLEFGESDFAEKYTAFSLNDRSIVMDPHRRLGEPYLPSCGYTALALWEAYKAEGGTDEAAKAYGVSKEDVELACSYYDHLTGTNAA
jgi:uncharacterized protein (DUF433 family)